MNDEKKRLRQTIRRRLASSGSLTESYRATAAERVKPRLAQIAESAQNILIYLSLPDEFPTFPLLWTLALSGGRPRNVLIPWCDGENLRLFNLLPAENDAPQRRAETFGESLSCGAFGILEPLPELRNLPEFQFDPARLDLIFLPGRAFDRRGNRLGRGKGFYDRFLAAVRPDCRLIGLAFDEQIVDTLPTEPHDRRMNGVITENGQFFV